MRLSCAFAPGLATPDHIAAAERLGYERAWCYDSPALYADVWVTLARAAERTTRIGLGAGVLIPGLRHVVTNAAAVATLAALAPGRVAIGLGAGFTGRLTLGQRPHRWADVRAYALALRALVRGEAVEWEGAPVALLHPIGFAPARPITVPLVIAAGGPKGLAVARDVADGVWWVSAAIAGGGLPWSLRSIHGTVLQTDETADSERVLLAAGHSAALAFHSLYEHGATDGYARLDALPGGKQWRAQIEALPRATRHLAIHDGHLVAPNAIDRAVITGDLLTRLGLAGDVASHRARLRQLTADGVTEIVYQPAGPDIERELATFAQAAAD